jgi:hypothetical protein
MSDDFRLPEPPLMPPERAREIARAYKGLADHFSGIGEQREAAKAERDSQWWMTYAITLAQTTREGDETS